MSLTGLGPEVCETWYEHPEGLEPPYTDPNVNPYAGVRQTRHKFVETKKGDVVITHAYCTFHMPLKRTENTFSSHHKSTCRPARATAITS